MMDPLAPPGTEDEPLQSSFSVSTKQQQERERLLSVKAVLPNGKYENVYEFQYVNGAEHWYCKACACPVMGWVFHHESGKRHSMSLRNHVQDRPHPTIDSVESSDIMIAPGEPVPPGFEEQIGKVALIQERLDVFTIGPLVALEYLLELADYDPSKEPTYLCVLCDKKGDPRTVLTHLVSYKHMLQYLQKHFPTAYRALAPYMTKQYKRNWQSTLHKIAEAIEKKFGRLKPLPIDGDKYEQETVYYLELIAKGRHFSELNGFTFEEYINKGDLTRVHFDDEADKPKQKSPSPPVVANPIKKIRVREIKNPAPSSAVGSRQRLSSVSSVSSSDLSDFEAPKIGSKPKAHRRSRSRSANFRNRSRSKSPAGRRYFMKQQRNLMPWEKPNYRRTKPDPIADRTRRIEKLEEYKKLSKAIETDSERILKNHKKNPEKHPQYNDEWKQFWNKRYKELQLEKKDVTQHDFKPEWIEYWNKRMIELHQEEIKTKKDALRRRLGLPEEPAPISFRISGKKKFDPSKANSTGQSTESDPNNDVIVIDDRDDESKGSRRSHSPWEDDPYQVKRRRSSEKRPMEKRRSNENIPEKSHSKERRDRRTRSRSWERDYTRAPRRIRTTAELPWERDRRYRDDCYKPPPIMRDVTREPVMLPAPEMAPAAEDDEEGGELNVVSILRLLTALEEKLGSLGPKIIDLLSNALALEKHEANSSETLLDSEINCVLFETVKEKLKGQLLAGLVEAVHEKAFKNAIRKTASLIHAAGERKKEREKRQPRVDPVKVPGIGTVDKAAIAKQIANALILQGKTDVTQAELEQLINAVVGMAEASQKANKLITTASFLDQYTKSAKAGPSAVVVKEKSPTPPPPPIHMEIKEAPVSVATNMEGLSDSDLQTLLQNFKDLSTEEQHGLINYLKKLEAVEPDRVERLRKFVNLGGPKVEEVKREEVKKEVVIKEVARISDRESPFSNRLGGLNPSHEENRYKAFDMELIKPVETNQAKVEKLIAIDSDEEDYSFDDVVKAASKNVKQKELEKEREIIEKSFKMKQTQDEINLDETKALINNIMNNINSGTSSTNKLKANVDLANTISNMNVANLANIVGSVQNITSRQTPPFNTTPQNINHQNYGYGGGGAPSYGQQPFYQAPRQQFEAPRPQFGAPQQRPNVAYPVDKPSVAYPNYGSYIGGPQRPNNDFGGPQGPNDFGGPQGPNHDFGGPQGPNNDFGGQRPRMGGPPYGNQFPPQGNNSYPNYNNNSNSNNRW